MKNTEATSKRMRCSYSAKTPTQVNGEKVGQWGTEIKTGDVISFGDVEIDVI